MYIVNYATDFLLQFIALIHVLVCYSALTQKGLLGGVGTLKRKQHLRELVDNHNKDHHDDVFDATPFKKRAKINNVRLILIYTFTFYTKSRFMLHF